MAMGKVIIDEVNLFQGDLPTVENRLLYIGNAPSNQNTWQFINRHTDLDAVLGAAASDLKTQLEAAKENSSDGWCAYAIPKANASLWQEAMLAALESMGSIVDFEGMVLCDAAQNVAGIDGLPGTLTAYIEAFGVYPFVLAALPGINAETQDWSAYKTAMNTLVSGIADKRIVPVPQLHGNNLGVLAGRLCRADVSVADSPMRVATGAVVGLGDDPVDMNGIVLNEFDLADLDGFRLSVPQRYLGYPGTYWGDANTLDVPGSDFAVLENLRVVRKASRAVRLLQIARVADRKLNNTPASIASNKIYFMRPLRDMSKGFTFNGVTFPGDIKPPADDAIEIVWQTHTLVHIYLKVTPYESPKELRAHIALDLSTGTSLLA